eukprot:2150608-Amphidinium_carterae.1
MGHPSPKQLEQQVPHCRPRCSLFENFVFFQHQKHVITQQRDATTTKAQICPIQHSSTQWNANIKFQNTIQDQINVGNGSTCCQEVVG